MELWFWDRVLLSPGWVSTYDLPTLSFLGLPVWTTMLNYMILNIQMFKYIKDLFHCWSAIFGNLFGRKQILTTFWHHIPTWWGDIIVQYSDLVLPFCKYSNFCQHLSQRWYPSDAFLYQSHCACFNCPGQFYTPQRQKDCNTKAGTSLIRVSTDVIRF